MGIIKAYIKHLKKAISNAAYLNESLPYYIGYVVARQNMEALALSSQTSGIVCKEIGSNEIIVSYLL